MSDQPPAIDRLVIRYIKSNFFRVMYADGAIAGVTPNGGVHIEFYNTRPALPDRATHAIVDGLMTDEIESERISSGGLVREVEGQFVMSAEVAEAVIGILQSQVEVLKKVKQARSEAKNA
jgi:hypothetical protein